MDTCGSDSALQARPARILVAEDDVEMRRLVLESLARDGYDLVDVTDAGQLLLRLGVSQRTQENPIDLVITDIRMPVCSGLEIARSLRDAHWTMPIVMMTAFGDAETREHARNLGAVLIDKPFKMKTLRSLVRTLLVPQGERR